jgi:hypothetical protein
MQSILRTLILPLVVLATTTTAQNVAVNNTGAAPHASAMFDIQSNSKGVLIPRMTTAERNAIASPANGLLVFDVTTSSFWFRQSSSWRELIDGSNSPWVEDASLNVRTRNGSNVSISPGSPLGFGKLNVVAQTPETNTTESVIQVIRSTSGTAAAGLGGSIDFYHETSNGGFPATARIVCESTNTTPGSHGGSLEFYTSSGGVLGSQLFLGAANVGIGTSVPSIFSKLDVNGTINTDAKITRNTITGVSNLVPLCYGAVDAAGNITASTGNFTVLKTSTGTYTITNPGFDGNCIIIVTPRSPNIGSFTPRTIMTSFFIGDIYVQAYNAAGSPAECGFHFIVYKQ